ncbi:MAG: hypothetical protein A2Y77_13960 [Planctomycetes bacterium RBG_13_62_9]|nr:MAG: hypothetical protein A2Y77_13960 [Planctomycetes bacterium RBG_13_62_9]
MFEIAAVSMVGLPMTIAGAGETSTPAQSGRVLDFQVISRQTKEPIAGVSLEIRIGSQTRKEVTNEQGRCKIEYGPPVDYLSVRASKQGLVPVQVAWRPGESRPAIPDSYTLALEPGTSIGGIVQGEDGKPIEGVSVSLLVPSSGAIERVSIMDHREKTDANGRWRCDIVPAKLDDLWIRLEHPDYISDEMYGKTPKPPMERLRDMTGVMVMKRGFAVTGRVRDAEGRPIEGASVSQGSDRFGTRYPSIKTDSDGRFRFGNARPGEMVLTVQAQGHAPDLRQIVVHQGTELVEFRLEAGHTLRGQVVDKAGNPISGAFVAVDTWRGHRSLSWRTDTDAQGRFQWTEAPSDEVLVDVSKQGYMSVSRNAMTASDKEYAVAMPPQLRISGRVVDKETGRPIPKFTAIPGIDWGTSQSVYWERRVARPFTDGRFEITLGQPYPGHLIRIEAEGYLPEVSRSFDSGEGEVVFDVAMKRGTGPNGTVCLPDGKPVVGAEVILCTASQGAYIRNGKNEQRRESLSVQTGLDGRFAFPAQTDQYTLVVLHDAGYAEVTEADLGASPTLTLRPWGRVEGKVMIGSKPGANEAVRVLFDQPREAGAPRIYHDCSAVADKEGQFIFDRVPPGGARACREMRISERMSTFTQEVPIEIKAGETTSVTIGGMGRPVIGKVAIPNEVRDKLDWQNLDCSLRNQSPESHARTVAVKFEPDGAFRADDVPAGSYCLYFYAYTPPTNTRSFRGERLGSLTHPFAVPEMPGGRSDEPLDLGVLELLTVGGSTVAPALTGKPMPDLKQLQLSIPLDEMNGKKLLICFFDMQQRPSRNAVVQLAKQAQTLKDSGIVAVVVQVSKTDETAIKDWARQNVVPFPTGMISGDENKARLAWGVRSLPWLILTDERRVVAAEGFGVEELDTKIKNLPAGN